MRLLIVGHGRMGKLIESLASAQGFEIVGVFDIDNNPDGKGLADSPPADVAIEFATPSATIQNLPLYAQHGINAVVGTTGWQEQESQLRRIVAEAPVGVVVSSNFSLGANLFQSIIEHAARQFAQQADYGAWMYEAHHVAKKDAPSGTALTLKAAMEMAGYRRRIDVSSTRAGSIPGTHTVGFDGPFDAVTLTHTNRDRAAFALGALEAARWVMGKRGWFTMKDVLGIT